MQVSGDIRFRAAEMDDALCVGMLATQVFLDTYATDGVRPDLAREVLANCGPASFEARIRDPSNRFELAVRAEHLVAFSECRLSARPPVASLPAGTELVRLYVQRPWQRRGIGAALLARAEREARSRGSDLLWLTAWEGNSAARAFYAAQGYEDAGRAHHVFEDRAYGNRVYRKALRSAR